MGGAIVPCPRRQPRKTLQPPPCQSVSQRYLSSDLPSGSEFFPLQISSAPPHKGSSLSQREECTGRSEPVSPRPGRADGGQTVPAKRLQQAAFFRPGAFPSLTRSYSRRTGRATRPSKGDLVPGGVSIFPSRLDRAGGRGSRLTRDGHSRKKSSAVAFPQPGAPSTRVKSPTPLRGKGSWQCLLWGRSLYRMPRAISIMLVRASSRSAEEMDCFSPFRVSEMVSRVAALLPLRAAL